ncbi:hypothetical protein JHK85_027916 [Glycine max]|nr:hypothetical protein JHK85_027916 [Glycine max]
MTPHTSSNTETFPVEQEDLHKKWKLVSKRLRKFHQCVVLPVGCLSSGLCHVVVTFLDAILSKTLCGTLALLVGRGCGKSAALGLSIVGAIVVGIAFRPQFLSFKVTSLIVTSFTTNTRGELMATFHADGVLGNPNYVLSIWYKSLDIELWFENHTVSSALIEPLPFSIGAKTDTLVQTRYMAINMMFPSGVAMGITVRDAFMAWSNFESCLKLILGTSLVS